MAVPFNFYEALPNVGVPITTTLITAIGVWYSIHKRTRTDSQSAVLTGFQSLLAQNTALINELQEERKNLRSEVDRLRVRVFALESVIRRENLELPGELGGGMLE